MNRLQPLPRAAPARVLAFGAWLKNSACLLDGATAHWSPLHGDLATPTACLALEASAQSLLDRAGGRIDAVAHDLHPDFESTRLALAYAHRLGVPAVPVQHHHAHVAVVQAEQGSVAPVIGLALDGVGLGPDGSAWGGELLYVAGARWSRLGHLTPLLLPGGDRAAREPWRMAAAALHALGRDSEIVPRLTSAVGEQLAAGVAMLLDRGLHCSSTTSAGRWFDAMAGLLALSVRQQEEAEAAKSLEQYAVAWLTTQEAPAFDPQGLDLRPLVQACLALADRGATGAAAALFHVGLADGLAQAAIDAAAATGSAYVVLGGGCFHNRLLSYRVVARLNEARLDVQQPRGPGPGDTGLALGQAWVAAHQFVASPGHNTTERFACV